MVELITDTSMSSLRNLFLVLPVLFSGLCSGQDSVTYNLQQCIDIAVRNNIDLKRSEYAAQTAGARLNQARAATLPYASAFASQGINQGKSINPYTNSYVNKEIITGQYGINAGLTLFNGFSILNGMRQYAFGYKANTMDAQQAKTDLTISVILAYLHVLSSEEQLNLAMSQVGVSKAQVDRLELLNKNNAANPQTLFDTKGQLSNDELNYINAKQALESSKIALFQLMNVNKPGNVKFEKLNTEAELARYNGDLNSLYAESQNMAMVKAAEYRRLSAKKSVQAARGQLLPTFSLNGSLGTNYSDAAVSQTLLGSSDAPTDNYVLVGNVQTPVYAPQYSFRNDKISYPAQFKNNLNSYIGVSVQVPIFNALRLKTQVNYAKINEHQAESVKDNVNIQLKLSVEQAFVNMTASYDRYQVLAQQVQSYGSSFKIALSKFEAGALTSVDFMLAKSNMDRANNNFIAAKYDYMLKARILDYYKGKI
ncbi:MAG: TolC family protein [Bacteroidia bacterium]